MHWMRAGVLALSFGMVVAVTGADGPYVIVLGVAQDGGSPHVGCRGECCAEAWGDPAARVPVACLGLVEPDGGQRWLFEATPDYPAQAAQLLAASPASAARAPDGIFLTHAHVGHYTGLMYLGREALGAAGVAVYAAPRMRAFLRDNGPWGQLVVLGNIRLEPLVIGQPVSLGERIRVTAFRVPHRDEYSETVGYSIRGPRRTVAFVPDIDKWERWERGLEAFLRDVDVAYVDGTFYAGGELPGRDMREIPHPFVEETIARLRALPAQERAKVRFIHFNHTNPLLRGTGPEVDAVEADGFGVARLGEREEL